MTRTLFRLITLALFGAALVLGACGSDDRPSLASPEDETEVADDGGMEAADDGVMEDDANPTPTPFPTRTSASGTAVVRDVGDLPLGPPGSQTDDGFVLPPIEVTVDNPTEVTIADDEVPVGPPTQGGTAQLEEGELPVGPPVGGEVAPVSPEPEDAPEANGPEPTDAPDDDSAISLPGVIEQAKGDN